MEKSSLVASRPSVFSMAPVARGSVLVSSAISPLCPFFLGLQCQGGVRGAPVFTSLGGSTPLAGKRHHPRWPLGGRAPLTCAQSLMPAARLASGKVSSRACPGVFPSVLLRKTLPPPTSPWSLADSTDAPKHPFLIWPHQLHRLQL